MENIEKMVQKDTYTCGFPDYRMVIIYCISGILMNHMDTWGYDISYLPVLNEMTEMHYGLIHFGRGFPTSSL